MVAAVALFQQLRYRTRIRLSPTVLTKKEIS
jgi:hypothetical protein